MQNTKILLFAALLFAFPVLAAAEDGNVGCCLNPGAGALACSTERLSTLSECCPKPENANPSYYDAASSGPQDFTECTSNFFFSGQSCDTVNQCEQGCCCSDISSQIKTRAQCTGTGTAFHAGETDCNAACNVSQCKDGVDNDGNGCADFPADSGCASLSDAAESGGACLTVSGADCDNINYAPKITNMKATPVKGQKKIGLSWQNECASSLVSNNVYRCAGTNCAGFSLIGTSSQNIFIDEDDSLKFDAAYTYKVESTFSIQTAKPTATTTALIGNLECWNKLDNNNFCIHESYYNQYRDYLIGNFAGFSAQNFFQNVRSTFSGKLNRAFLCNEANVLMEEGTACNANQACVISNNEPVCVEKSACIPDEANLFGMFFTRTSCEGNKYCFYGRSISTVDSCFACNPGMSCYDYKSKESCGKNNCNAGNCIWNSLSDELGTGVCIDQDADNCRWCDSRGTEGMESSKATSVVFEQCTEGKADKLSSQSNACYYNGQKALNCDDVICTDLLQDDCASTSLQHDELNIITNNAANKCRLKICQNFNGLCKKNADADNKADCNTNECEQDVFAPNTTIVPIIDRGLYKSLSIQIFDKVSGKGSFTRRATNDYKTYLCKEPCGSAGHPYQNFTNSYSLIVSNLHLFDTLTGKKLLDFGQGNNIIRYYSQDPAKNIGKVKTVQITAQTSSSGPIVFRLNITNGKVVDNVYYTNSKNPVIKVEFFENAIVTSAQLLFKGTETALIPNFTSQLSKTATFAFPRQINAGEYTFVLNAKNDKGIFMGSVFRADIVVDDAAPRIVSITPAENAVISSSPVSIIIKFNKKVKIQSIKISGKDFTDNFSTTGNIEYTAAIPLEDGNKRITINAMDFAGNSLAAESGFIVNSNPLEIKLIKPPLGVSPLFTFDIVVGTDNNATCRYSLDANLEFDFMSQFDSSGGTEHKSAFFNAIPSGDKSVHKLYVRCNDPLQEQAISVFDLSVDAEKPKIKTAFAFPNPIIEIPRNTSLKVETDKESVCKYSITTQDFNLMEGKFQGFDDSLFSKINKKEITVQEDGLYSYFAACKSKAGLISDTQKIAFSSDTTLPIRIISHTPAYSNTSAITLAVETNKKSQCKYSSNDHKVSEGTLMGVPSYSHTKELALDSGAYIYYVICKDQFLQKWSDQLQIEFTIDTTPPRMVFVDDTHTLELEITCNTDRLRVKWLGEDKESGIKEYFYSILKKNNEIILDWTRSFWYSDTGYEWEWINESLDGEPLRLDDNAKYFFKVKSANYVSLESSPKNSDGITVNTSSCLPKPNCGDNLINSPGEECDGTAFSPKVDNCNDYTNFIGGTLICMDNCRLDSSQCIARPTCGNGELDPDESCDGTKFGVLNSCAKYHESFTGGTLKCTSKCELDTSSCAEQPNCGNGIINVGETCDGSDLGDLTGKCVDYKPGQFTGGIITCANNCQLDTLKCQGLQGSCGDSIINIGEDCDGVTFGEIKICTDIPSFTGGNLTCNPATCKLDTSKCLAQICGNSFINKGESCDENNFGLSGNSDKCIDYSLDFKSGALKCKDDCSLDTSGCTKAPKCGNSGLDTGELCDGSLFYNLSDLSCSSYSPNFVNGTLKCRSCEIKTDDCKSNDTISPIVRCKDTGDCGLNEPCADNSDCAGRFCSNNKCSASTCEDGAKNQGETDIDCGGPCSKECNNDKSCSFNSDCETNFCSFGTCQKADTCNDGILSGTESDIDCGGACPDKCSTEKSCNSNDDCSGNLKCISSKCSEHEEETVERKEREERDTDKDGMPDDWELQQGMDPNDPSDAEEDSDKDGLSNLQEYAHRTDPNNADTDRDEASDKKEIDKGTDPLDPESRPKGILWIFFLIFILISVLAAGGYGAYRYHKSSVERRNIARKPLLMPRTASGFQQRKLPQGTEELFRRKEEQKQNERKKLFAAFGTGSKQKTPEQKPLISKPAETKHGKLPPKQDKEDIIARLKLISKKQKSKKP